MCTEGLKINDTVTKLRIIFTMRLLFQVDTAPMLDCGFLGALIVDKCPYVFHGTQTP